LFYSKEASRHFTISSLNYYIASNFKLPVDEELAEDGVYSSPDVNGLVKCSSEFVKCRLSHPAKSLIYNVKDAFNKRGFKSHPSDSAPLPPPSMQSSSLLPSFVNKTENTVTSQSPKVCKTFSDKTELNINCTTPKRLSLSSPETILLFSKSIPSLNIDENLPSYHYSLINSDNTPPSNIPLVSKSTRENNSSLKNLEKNHHSFSETSKALPLNVKSSHNKKAQNPEDNFSTSFFDNPLSSVLFHHLHSVNSLGFPIFFLFLFFSL
jgi:hypothetical protein